MKGEIWCQQDYIDSKITVILKILYYSGNEFMDSEISVLISLL